MLRRKLGHLGEIHVRLDAAQLDSRKGVRGSEVEDLRPGPLRTSQRREPERESIGVREAQSVRGCEHCGGSLEELAAARHGHGRIVATTAVVHSPWLFLYVPRIHTRAVRGSLHLGTMGRRLSAFELAVTGSHFHVAPKSP